MGDVLWTKPALKDLDDIGAYIARDDPMAAANTVRRILEAVAGLTYFPHIGRVGRTHDTRELVVSGTPYIGAYRLQENAEILAVYHGARMWPEAF